MPKYILLVIAVLLLYLNPNILCIGTSVINQNSARVAIDYNLQNSKKYYKQAIELYTVGKIHQAEQLFLLVLKPILSKPKIRTIPLDEIYQIKEEVLMSMYHLGLIYLTDVTKANNYAKAAAIFCYCARFSEKYKCLLNADYFLERAYNTEKAMLNCYNISSNLEEADFYINKIQHYKKKLKDFRVNTDNKLYLIDKKFENWENWSYEVEQVYKEIFKFFINNEYPKSKGILQEMIEDAQKQIGPIPDGCEYAVIALGSFAAGTMTPWSDIEFAILINQEKKEYKKYFRKLTELLNIKIVNFGESQLRWMGIESLNNFATDKEEDDWFWDHISLFGFGLDGKHWHACENPLGRIGYKKKIIGNDNNILFKNRDNFELIHTPYHMSMFQSDDKNNKFPIEDPYLVQSLRSVAWIIGSEALVNEYRKFLLQVVKKEEVQHRIAQIFTSDLQKYRVNTQDISTVEEIDVKKEIYRLIDRLISAMGQYYFILPNENESLITLWNIIERLKNNSIINNYEAKKLTQALSIATRLRYLIYYNNFYDNNKDVLTRKELTNTDNINMLQHYYQIMLEMQDVLQLRLTEN